MWKMIGSGKGLQKREAGPVGGPRQTSLQTGTAKDLAKSAALTGYVYLLVDRSASMKKGNKIKQAQKGAIKFAKNALEQGYYTGLIQFDDLPTLVCEPEKDIANLEKAISTLTTGKHTHMAKAIRLAHSLLKNQTGMRVMVIVTDGLPNGEGDPQASLKAAEEARKDGIYIIAIGTDDANSDFLKHLATRFDLGVKIERNQLASAIIDSSRLLPPPQNKLQKRG
jgi:Mg-chelatase subunit ChlD